MKTVANIVFLTYLCSAAVSVILMANLIGTWRPGYTVTAELVIFGMLNLLGPFLLGVFVGRHQS